MSEHTSITALKSAEELAQELAAERARSASLQRLVTGAEQEITALRQERDRLLEESVASYSHGVEDMRERAAKLLDDARMHGAADQIRNVMLTPATPSQPWPVDGETSSCGCEPKPKTVEGRVTALEELTASLADLVEGHSRDISQAQAALRGIGKTIASLEPPR